MIKYIRKQHIMSLAFVALVFGALSVSAAPGDVASPLIHVGAGDQIVAEVQLGSSTNTSALLDVNEPGTNAVFDGQDDLLNTDPANATSFNVLFDGWIQDKLFVGNTSIEFFDPINLIPIVYSGQASSNLLLWTDNLGSAGIADLQKINIFGGLISSLFNTTNGNTAGNMQICVDSVGGFVACP